MLQSFPHFAAVQKTVRAPVPWSDQLECMKYSIKEHPCAGAKSVFPQYNILTTSQCCTGPRSLRLWGIIENYNLSRTPLLLLSLMTVTVIVSLKSWTFSDQSKYKFRRIGGEGGESHSCIIWRRGPGVTLSYTTSLSSPLTIIITTTSLLPPPSLPSLPSLSLDWITRKS